jgi:HSP20 family molecular chaperone IbpA
MALGSGRILHALFASGLGSQSFAAWQPSVDVYQVHDGWLLKFELAGVAPEDVSISIEGRSVIVRGSRLDRCLESGCSLQQMEIAYNQFERRVELPADISLSTIHYEFVHGMLLVRIHQEAAR